MSVRFGPLGTEGGERRLNVLISRAKRRCEVYAPLILVPVSLERCSAAERFKLRARQEEFASNLSLEAFMD